MAPTTKPCAATRMWIKCTDIFVSPRDFILYNWCPTIAKNPAIPRKEKYMKLHRHFTEMTQIKVKCY